MWFKRICLLENFAFPVRSHKNIITKNINKNKSAKKQRNNTCWNCTFFLLPGKILRIALAFFAWVLRERALFLFLWENISQENCKLNHFCIIRFFRSFIISKKRFPWFEVLKIRYRLFFYTNTVNLEYNRGKFKTKMYKRCPALLIGWDRPRENTRDLCIN